MEKQWKGPLPLEVDHLQRQVQAWRRTSKGTTNTPSELWEKAVEFGLQFGVCRIARAVGLDYTRLRTKVAQAKAQSPAVEATFMAIPASMLLPAGPASKVDSGSEVCGAQGSGAVIELFTPDGARMRICLEPGKGVESALIVAAFLGRGH